MDLVQFDRLNMRQFPALSVHSSRKFSSASTLPEAFFLHNEQHMIFVRTRPNKTAVLYDSLGRQSDPIFVSFLTANGYAIRQWFDRPLQRSRDSDSCTIHSALFSLGYYSLAGDIHVWRYIKPMLERMKINLRKTSQLSTCPLQLSSPMSRLKKLAPWK